MPDTKRERRGYALENTVQMIAARQYRIQILVECLDHLIHRDSTVTTDLSYIDLLIQRVPPPAEAEVRISERRKKQNLLRQDTIREYRGLPASDTLWCCMSRHLCSKKTLIAAHIVPHSIGKLHARY